MQTISQYDFYKTKYGDELLIDVVPLSYVKKFITKQPVHRLTYYDITLITSGTGFFQIDTHQYNVSEGDVLFSRPGEIRHWDKDKIFDGYALIFEEEFLLSFFNDSLFLKHLSCFKPGATSKLTLECVIYEQILNRIKNIKHEIDTYRVKDKHILRALLYETLMLLHRTYTAVHHAPCENRNIVNPRIEKFAGLVNVDFKLHHSTRYYADKLCITPNYLNEIIKDATGSSAKQYIQHKIVQEAKKMLTYTDLQISEIAGELGFDDLSYFIRLFRKQTGFPPLAYKKKVKAEKP
jgi:YesN/AraC family two-component response regulator